MRQKAHELLNSGDVNCVLAWRKGDFYSHPEVAFFTGGRDAQVNLIYNRFCAANLSRFLIDAAKRYDKTLVFLRPCDSFSFNQLVKEHLVDKDRVRVVGIGCDGCVDVDEHGNEVGLLESCSVCTKTTHAIYDELLHDDVATRQTEDENVRFAPVEEIEAKSADERYEFWRDQLSKCIRCNACRQACPVCNCKKCVFDDNLYDTQQKANSSEFEEQMFHIIRAFHVAGRCSDCGQCSRVCPQGINLELLNRKFIKDINEFYGDFQAGADIEAKGPLTSFKHDDYDPTGRKKK